MLCRSNQTNGDDNQTTLWYLSIHFYLLHNVFFFFVGSWQRSADILLSKASFSTSWDNPEAPAGQMGYFIPPVCFGSSPGSPPSWTSSGWCTGGQPHQIGWTISTGSAYSNIGFELFPHIHVSQSPSKWRPFGPLVSFQSHRLTHNRRWELWCRNVDRWLLKWDLHHHTRLPLHLQ